MGSSNETSYYGKVVNPWGKPGTWRLLRRLCSRGSRSHGTSGNSYRHRRLDSTAGGIVRHYRPEAHPWPSFTPGYDRLCIQPGSGRPYGLNCRRRSTHAECHVRLRQSRLYQHQSTGASTTPAHWMRRSKGCVLACPKSSSPKR